jgi:hypothetical protein
MQNAFAAHLLPVTAVKAVDGERQSTDEHDVPPDADSNLRAR